MRALSGRSDLFNFLFSLTAQSIGRAISIGSNVIVFLLVARILGADVLGRYAYFVTYTSLLATLVDFGTGETAAKDLGSLPESLRAPYWGNLLWLRMGLGLCGAVLGIVLSGFLRPDMKTELLIGSLSVPFVASRIFDPLFQIFNRPWYSSIASGAFGLLHLTASAFVLCRKNPSLLGLTVAFFIAHFLYALVVFLLSMSLLKPRWALKSSLLWKNLRIAVPLGLSSIFTMINSRADTFMLAWLRSDREVGLYNAAYKMVDIAATVMIVVTTPALPILAKVASENPERFGRLSGNVFSLMLIFLTPVAVLVPFFSDRLMIWLYGEEFAGAAAALNILGWVCLLICFSIVSSVMCLAVDLVNFAWWSSALAAFLNIVLNYHWIPEHGIIGASWATLLCEVVLLGITGITLLYLSRKQRDSVPWVFALVYLAVTGITALVLNKSLSFLLKTDILTFAMGSIFFYLCFGAAGFLFWRFISKIARN